MTDRCPPFLTPEPRRGACDGCGAVLTNGRRRWCGPTCEMRFWNNHGWGMARLEAIKRARVGTWHDGLGQALCDECAVPTNAPEVNHVEPRNGAGYGNGCWNHQTNLQVLCHGCHVAETTRQIRERAPDRPPRSDRPAPASSLPLWDFAA